jgi:hypothetical protein
MIKELSWYIKSNRFSSLAEELDGSVKKYAEANAAGTPQAAILREQARQLLQTQAVESGLKTEQNAFINIDAEFFNGTTLEQTKLDTFIKDIIKAHCYQKILWEYMGTTGTMTQISTTEMEKAGLNYRNYLPVAYKKTHPEKKPAVPADNGMVPFYLYNDGSISTAYDGKKAQLKFDTLKDNSGFNWHENYNPNTEIKKDGWYGAFDVDGTWKKVITEEHSGNTGRNAERQIQPLEIIRDGDSAILYDPDMLLLTPAKLLYFNGGNLYGAEEGDTDATVNRISETLNHMGIASFGAISTGFYPKNNSEQKKILEKYREILGSLSSAAMTVKSTRYVRQKKEENAAISVAIAQEKQGVQLQQKISGLIRTGNKGESVVTAALTGKASIPLSVRNSDDRHAAGISDKDYAVISAYCVPEEKEKAFSSAVIQLFLSWDLLKTSGLTRQELIEKIYQNIVLQTSETGMVTLEAPFEDIIDGKGLEITGTAPGTVPVMTDSSAVRRYTETLAEKGLIPAGMTVPLQQAAASIPPQKTAGLQQQVNQAIANVMAAFTAIQTSTGMTPAETIKTAVKIVHGQTGEPFEPPVSGFVDQTRKTQNRRVFSELSLSGIIERASRYRIAVKETETASLIHPDKTVDVTFGSSGRQTLADSIDKQTLEQTLGPAAAEQAEEFLHSIGTADSTIAAQVLLELLDQMQHGEPAGQNTRTAAADTAAEESVTPVQKTGNTFRMFQHAVYCAFEERAAYNLASESGRAAYVQSAEFKKSGLTEQELSSLAAEAVPEITRKPETGSVTVKPVYCQKPTEQPVTLKSQKGIATELHRIVRQDGPHTEETEAGLTLSGQDAGGITVQNLSGAGSGVSVRIPDAAVPVRLLHSLSGFDSSIAVPLSMLAGLDTEKLAADYGYPVSEAEKAVLSLTHYGFPKETASKQYAQLAPELDRVLKTGRTAQTLRKNMKLLMESLVYQKPGSLQTVTSPLAVFEGEPAASGTQLTERKAISPAAAVKSASAAQTEKTAVPVTELAGITEQSLIETYGYTAEESIPVLQFLSTLKIPATRKEEARTDLVPDIKALLENSTTAANLKQKTAAAFAQRKDITCNTDTEQGREAFNLFAATVPQKIQADATVPSGTQEPLQIQTIPAAGNGEVAVTLLHSNGGFDGSEAVPLSQLSALDEEQLTNLYGFPVQAAAQIFQTLQNYGLSRETAGQQYSIIAPQLERILKSGKSPQTFRRNMNQLAASLSYRNNSDTPVRILHSTAGFQGSNITPISNLAELTAGSLAEDYGYKPEEAEKALQTLQNYGISGENAPQQYAQIAPQMEKILRNGKTSQVLRRNMKTFSDSLSRQIPTAIRQIPAAGTAVFRTGISVPPMTPAAIPEAAVTVHGTDMTTPAFTGPETGMTLRTQMPSSPHSVTADTYTDIPLHTVRTAPTVPLTFPGQTPGIQPEEMNTLPESSSAHTDTPPLTGTGQTPAGANGQADAVSGLHLQQHETTQPQLSYTGDTTKNRELEKLRRINANYEHDRRILEREKTPALARSATHDVGHAEGNEAEDAADPRTMGKQLNRQFLDEARSIVL